MKKSPGLRNRLKKIYKKNKKDSVGKEINSIVQQLHQYSNLEVEKQDENFIKKCFEDIVSLRKIGRFRNEFPSFSSFYHYVVNPDNKLTLEDIKNLEST